MPRILTELKQSAKQSQAHLLESLRDSQHIKSADNPFWEEIKTCPDDKLNILGKIGETLRYFANNVCLVHPELPKLFGDEWNNFSGEVRESLSKKIENIDDFVKHISSKYRNTIKALMTIKPRFIADKDTRQKIRSIKNTIRPVDLKKAIEMNDNGYHDKPCDFESLLRYNTAYLSQISKFEEQEKIFIGNNMKEVANAVRKRISAIDEQKQTQYLGFYRLKTIDAAIISSKMHGLKYTDHSTIVVSSKYFENRLWFCQPDIDEKKKQTGLFYYEPRVYPLTSLDIPETAQRIVDLLDNLPEQADCPVFDYYWVLVPSISVAHPLFKKADNKYIVEHNGTQEFAKETDATIALDRAFIAENYFLPTLLGEREGICYYICPWC